MPPSPRPPGRGPADNAELDALRAQLNETLAQQNYDEAVDVARRLRALLKARPTLDARQLKSLAGAESVLRRFAEEGSTRIESTKHLKIAWAVGTAVVVLGILLFAVFGRTGADPYTRSANQALEALDRIDGAVAHPLGASDYERVVRKEREVVSSFLSQFRDDHRNDVGYLAIGAAMAAYDSVMSEWPKSSASSKRLSTSEVNPTVTFPRLWLAAHVLEACARRVVRKEQTIGRVDANSPVARLVGHWSDGSTDLYYGAPDPSTGIGVLVTRSTRSNTSEVVAYELAPANAPGPNGATPTPTPRPSPSGSGTAGGSVDIRIVQYLPRPSTIVLRVSADHYAGGSFQLVRLDDKTMP